MKSVLYILAFVAILALALVSAMTKGIVPALWIAAAGTACVNYLFAGNKVFGQGVCNVTLVQSILAEQIFPAFRTKVPELSFFSVDYGKVNGAPPVPVKWEQEVISKMMIAPTAADYTPGTDLTTGATGAETLAVDVKLRIDRAAIVNVKLTAANAAALAADEVFKESLVESGKTLSRFVISKVIAGVTQKNFSSELVTTLANTDYDVLEDATTDLNENGAGVPRFCLGGSSWMQKVGADARTASGDYAGQRLEGDPYRSYKNIAGFSEVREFPNMPTNTTTLGTFTANTSTEVLTVSAAHGLAVGDRVRVSSTTTLPAGLAAATDYYVLTVPSTTTLTVSATIGGSAVNITDTGTGTHTIQKYEGLNAFAFAQNAIHIAFRPLEYNDALAASLGIPKAFKRENVMDEETGLTFTLWLYQAPTTGDIYAAVVVFFGFRAGRGLSGATNPMAETAGSTFDKAGLRIVELASTLA